MAFLFCPVGIGRGASHCAGARESLWAAPWPPAPQGIVATLCPEVRPWSSGGWERETVARRVPEPLPNTTALPHTAPPPKALIQGRAHCECPGSHTEEPHRGPVMIEQDPTASSTARQTQPSPGPGPWLFPLCFNVLTTLLRYNSHTM